MNVRDVIHKRKRGNETSSKLWYLCLGHISKERMERLIREEILPKLDFSDLDQCVDCIKGKFAKQIKKDGAKRSSRLLKLIHTDICGPFNVRSVDGFSYFITFTDDFSRYGYIYPIREKSEALDKFKIFKAKVENQHELKIKVVRSNKVANIMGDTLHMDKFPNPLLSSSKKME